MTAPSEQKPAATRARIVPSTRVVGRLVVVLLVILVPICLYMLVVVRSQRAYYTGRNFRVLQSIAAQISGQLDALPTMLGYYVADDPQVKKKRDEALTALDPTARMKGDPKAEPIRRRAVETLRSMPPPPADVLARIRGFEKLEVGKKDVTCGDSATPTRKFELEDDRIVVEYRDCNSPEPGVRATLPIADLLIAAPARGAFDEILIGDPTGRVVFRSGRERSGLQALNVLRDRAPKKDEAGKGDASKQSPLETGEARTHAFVQPISIGDLRYLVFVQPTVGRFPTRAKAPDEGPTRAGLTDAGVWYVAGLVPEQRFEQDVRAVPLPFLVIAVLAVVAGGLAWPFLRLWLRSPEAKIPPREVAAIALSTALGVAIATVVIMDWLGEVSADRRRDHVLEEVSRSLKTSFRAELEGARWTLLQQADVILSGGATPTVDCARPGKPDQELLGFQTNHFYPPFELAFVLDEKGTQRGLLRSHRDSCMSTGFDVHDREYFRRVRSGLLDTDPKALEQRFAVDRIRARDQGVLLSVLSIPIERPRSRWPSRVGVLATRFQTFWSPVLPDDVQFAVIQNLDGLVLHHSDDSRSLIENFYTETDRNQRLRAAVAAGRSEWLSGQYFGIRKRFHVSPIEGLDWSLVVFQDERIPEAVRVQRLLVSIGHLMLYGIGIAFVIALLTWLVPNLRWTWVWPDPTKRGGPVVAAPVLALVAAYGVLAMLAYQGIDVVVTAVALPCFAVSWMYLLGTPAREGLRIPRAVIATAALLGVGALTFAAWHAARSPTPLLRGALVVGGCALVASIVAMVALRHVPSGRVSIRVWQALYVLTLCLLCWIGGVVPAIGIYQDVFDFESLRATRHAELRALRRFERRSALVNEDAMRLSRFQAKWEPQRLDLGLFRDALHCTEGTVWAVFPPQRRGSDSPCGRVIDVKPPADGAPAAATEALLPVLQRNFTAWLSLALPPLSYRFALRRDVAFDETHNARWHWTPDCVAGGSCEGPAALVYRRDAGNPTAFYLTRAPVELDVPYGWIGWSIIAIVIAGGMTGLYVVLAGVARRLFWLEHARPLPPPSRKLPDDRRVSSAALLSADDTALDRTADDLFARLGAEAGVAIERIDLRKPTKRPPGSAPDGQRLTGVTFFEHLDAVLLDARKRRELRLEIERLLTRQHDDLVLTTDPLSWFALAGSSESGGAGPSDQDADVAVRAEIEAWTSLLRGIPRFDAVDGGTATRDGERKRHERTVDRECGYWRALAPIAVELRADATRLDRMTTGEIVATVAERAHSVFRLLWANCTRAERLVLLHLAQGNLVSPRNGRVVDALERRGLVRRDPIPRLVSRSLAAFVRGAEQPERVRAWEAATADSPWNATRGPLALLLALVGAFVVYSGRDSMQASLALLPALASAVPALLSLAQTLGGGRGEIGSRG